MKTIKLQSPQGHKRACVPCALSIVLDRSYESVNQWLKYRGIRKRDTSGTSTWKMDKSELGLHRLPNKYISVNQFVKQNPQGTFFILVAHHALALKNGIVFDTINSEKKSIREVYQRNNPDIMPWDWNSAQQNFVIKSLPKKSTTSVKQPKGQKRKILIDLISQGNVGSISELAKAVGCSYIYARYMILEMRRMKSLHEQSNPCIHEN